MPTDEQYLKRKGWVKDADGGLWCWHLPPVPGRYKLQDALDLQRSWDNSKGNRPK